MKKLMCVPPTRQCYFNECGTCSEKVHAMKRQVVDIFENEDIDEVKYILLK